MNTLLLWFCAPYACSLDSKCSLFTQGKGTPGPMRSGTLKASYEGGLSPANSLNKSFEVTGIVVCLLLNFWMVLLRAIIHLVLSFSYLLWLSSVTAMRFLLCGFVLKGDQLEMWMEIFHIAKIEFQRALHVIGQWAKNQMTPLP